jgi:acyl-CoA reductase-like NAD-dependent aldehyde dehydrogenase
MTAPADTTPATSDLRRYQLIINGRHAEAASGQRFDSVDPFLGASWATAADGDAPDVDLAVAAARAALAGPWGQLSGFGRARLMRRLADILTRDADQLADVETRDTGKLLREMRGQLATIPDWFYYFAGLADKLEGTTIPSDKSNFLVYTRREPAGVIAAIVPWNSPLLLLCWKLAPALAAGCTVVAKPSDYSPASAVELADKMAEAGFPAGVFNVVTGFGPAVGKALAAHPDVDKVAFTGSTTVGAEVAKAAAGNITGVLLELGGKSAHVVFADADLDATCNGVLAGVFAATGQTCMAGSRLLVQREVHDALVARIVDRAGSIRLGDPRDIETEMGPLATEPQYRKVLSFFASAAAEGATVAAGGRPEERLGGYFVQPTVLDERYPPRPPGGACAAGRHGLDQCLPRRRARRPVWRLRHERSRPGERHRRRAGVHPDQGHLGRAHRRHPRSFHPRLSDPPKAACRDSAARSW